MTQICETTGRDGLSVIYSGFFSSELAMHELFLFALDAAGRFFFSKSSNLHPQCAKKVLLDSLGLEDFAIWLVSFVLSLQFK